MKRDIELLHEIGRLRFMDRTWKQFFGPDVANVAEHTLRVAWIALIIAENEGGVDTGRLLKMALVHDVPESRTGDVNHLSRQYVTRHEEMALQDILAGTSVEKEMVAAGKEAERKISLEARILKDADNLDVELELQELQARGHDLGGQWVRNRRQQVYPKLFTETARLMWEEIHRTHPHDWHLNARNRFNTGDWKQVMEVVEAEEEEIKKEGLRW